MPGNTESNEKIRQLFESFYGSLDGMEQVELWPDGAPNMIADDNQRSPRVAFTPKTADKRGMVIICPGGGYYMKVVYEGRCVAEAFRAKGFNTAVLDYRCQPYTPHNALQDAQRAIRLVRENAERLNADPEKIAIGGFSAGGHLSGLAGTHFDAGDAGSSDPVERNNCRPDAVIQCYGTVSILESGKTIIGDVLPDELAYLNPEYNVTPQTPPFFMWTTRDDCVVDVRWAYNMANALGVHKIPYELHVFPYGHHSLGLADGSSPVEPANPHIMHWVNLAAEFLTIQGF